MFENEIDSIFEQAVKKTNKQKQDLFSDSYSDLSAWVTDKKQKRIKPVEDWNNTDLLKYFRYRSKDKFGKIMPEPRTWGLDSEAMEKICDKYEDFKHIRPKMTVLKEYIDWFVSEHADMLIDRYGILKWKFVNNEYSMRSFLEYKNQHQFVTTYKEQDNFGSSTSFILTESTIKSHSMKGPEHFVKTYGFILPVIWYHYSVGLPKKESILKVIDTVVNLVNSGFYSDILDRTDEMSPYPNFCNFEGLNKMLDILTEKTNKSFNFVTIDFEENPVKYIGFVEMLGLE